ncbi:MAG: transglycosylase SLT domain-containing protein [bacterium]
MSFKINNRLKYATLISLMAINPNNYLNEAQNKLSLSSDCVKGEKNIETESLDDKFNSYDYMWDSFFSDVNLINKAITNNTSSSMDSVIKFVDKSSIKKYLFLNKLSDDYVNGEPTLNKLRILLKSGAEVAKDRFNTTSNGSRGLEGLANALDVEVGSYEANMKNSLNFLEIYKDDIKSAASKYDLNPDLIAGLLVHESGGRSFTMSKTGALGSAQLTSYIYDPTYLGGVNKSDINPFDTPQAIDRAADYLSYLIDRYERFDDSNHTLALTAYNQGPNAMSRTLKIARSNGVIAPRDIVNFTYASSDNNKKYVLSHEGRMFSSNVQNEIVKAGPVFKDKYLASLD